MILVCGEALVDLVPTGDGALLSPKLGGGPFNVAVTLGRLGSAVSFLSRVSTDAFGNQIAAALDAAGVDRELMQRGREPTTLALTMLDAGGGAQYSFYADGTADRLVEDPGPLASDITALSFGTLSLLFEPGASVYGALLHRAHRSGKFTMLDPNIRPAAIDSSDDFRARFQSWLPSVDILKVSDDDAHWLGIGAQGTTLDQWLSRGVAVVIVTRGGDGISAFTRDMEVDVPGVAVDVVDTIGAGDTVHGALLHHLESSGSLSRKALEAMTTTEWKAALTFAAKAASITVSRPGADPPWAHEAASG